ncbi:uncharacterized protein BDR25DRAFT_360119 [Lindgomyces ingoldianus]|uniref:Uncharacterized protein n=1 Tax=Lindgomyces ingoldianus TaxID=673940 RepID=A0ACB6QHH1_9PLEO|nr:uncharacterized protein BDR25DRAFT_360119 [Lindgomyces ingoldianus]KAF2465955.1 hypothetical protein BDR25DRAFT_360119 [Lindgomyces ingoldianus]
MFREKGSKSVKRFDSWRVAKCIRCTRSSFPILPSATYNSDGHAILFPQRGNPIYFVKSPLSFLYLAVKSHFCKNTTLVQRNPLRMPFRLLSMRLQSNKAETKNFKVKEKTIPHSNHLRSIISTQFPYFPNSTMYSFFSPVCSCKLSCAALLLVLWLEASPFHEINTAVIKNSEEHLKTVTSGDIHQNKESDEIARKALQVVRHRRLEITLSASHRGKSRFQKELVQEKDIVGEVETPDGEMRMRGWLTLDNVAIEKFKKHPGIALIYEGLKLSLGGRKLLKTYALPPPQISILRNLGTSD